MIDAHISLMRNGRKKDAEEEEDGKKQTHVHNSDNHHIF